MNNYFILCKHFTQTLFSKKFYIVYEIFYFQQDSYNYGDYACIVNDIT